MPASHKMKVDTERKKSKKDVNKRKSPKEHPFRMHAFTIRDLTQKDIELLTLVLHRYRTDEESVKKVQDLIASLPPQLRRSGFLNLISNRTSRLPAVAPACSLHRPLNGQVIRSIFNLVALEVGVRINHLVASSDKFSYVQRASLESLRELHSMWLEPNVYSNTFLQLPSPQWSYQEDKCEACILARIGGDVNILISLRAVMLSRTRTKKRRRRPRITRWLEEWIKHHEDLKGTMFKNSDEDGKAFKNAWKAAYKSRIAHGQNNARERDSRQEVVEDEGINSVGDGGDDEREPSDKVGEDTYDHEHEIIDHYAALLSSQYLPLKPQGSTPRQQASSTPMDPRKPPQAIWNKRMSGGSEWEDDKSVYWHPRQGPRWSGYYRNVQSPEEQAVTVHNGNNDRTSSDGSSTLVGSSKTASISPSKSDTCRGSQPLADSYREVIDRDCKRYSGSVYSRQDGDPGKSVASLSSTTWSMLYK